MKIRNDFVSNNSSVSYIITMKKDIVEMFSKIHENYRKNEVKRITEFLKGNIIENGTRIYLDGGKSELEKLQE